MKIVQKIYNENQKNFIKNLSLEAGISEFTAEILYGRGYETASEITEFLNPDKVGLKSPYQLSQMKDAIDRIVLAKNNNEKIVVFGDYDADGICATTILYNALKIFGVEVYTVIPERDNGYGLSEGILSEVVEEYLPDLIITVDCGISAKNEVEYLKDLGVDVIVTDHHEFPPELPECIIVSTKTPNQEYDFEYLSGAGVAYKLASALIGDIADSFLDLVAVATIADSMPLINENRVLVHKGVELIKTGRCSKPISMLLSASNAREITASSLAFTVAPRINAAGRMGDAYSCLKLFLSDSQEEREELVKILSDYNTERQVECENLYKSAKSLIKTKGHGQNVIVLYNKTWKTGLLGIVASRLCEEYNLPTILFGEVDGYLRGSARSTENVNLFEAISSTSDLLVDFGGHAQASGLTLKEENLNEFISRINDYVLNNFNYNVEKSIEVDGEILSPLSLKTAKELSKFEPFGTGNKKPLFLLKANKVSCKYLKEGSAHVSAKTKDIDLIYFNGAKHFNLLKEEVDKSLLVEVGVSTYNNKDYVKGFLKTVICNFKTNENINLNCFIMAIRNLQYGAFNAQAEQEKVDSYIKNINPAGFGKLFVVTNPENLQRYPNLLKLETCLYNLTAKGGKNALLIGGDVNSEDISDYDEIVVVDRPFGDIYLHKNQELVSGEINAFSLDKISTILEDMRSEYRSILPYENMGYTLFDVITNSLSPYQTAFAIEVFKELQFIKENGYFIVDKSVKADLEKSKIYQGVLNIKNA